MRQHTSTALISCEHGGHRVPAAFSRLFRGMKSALRSHRGWDPGALQLARDLAATLDAPLVASQTTRLLVDLNRSRSHRQCLGKVLRTTNKAQREAILSAYYDPYRDEVQSRVRAAIASGRTILHLSAHSFTPRLGNRTRNADVGLLYDPSRNLERQFCTKLLMQLREQAPALVIRRNYPYRGTADGLTTGLRRCFAATDYLGIELEINQKHVARSPGHWARLRALLTKSIAAVIDGADPE